MDWKLRFHQSANPGTTHVVISRETERFVNEIHNHNAEVRSSEDLIDKLHESKKEWLSEERKVPPRHKETLAAPRKNLVQVLSLLVPKKLPYTQGKSFSRMIESGLQFRLIQDVQVIWEVSPKTVTTTLRHFDQDERETDGSGFLVSFESILVRKFEREGAIVFSDETWLQKII